jgi:fibrillarin-like rRNA methylase
MNIYAVHSSETLFFRILNNKALEFSPKQLKNFFEKLNKRNQQMVLKNVCLFLSSAENKKEQKKELLFLLYDCNMIISKQTTKWIEKKGFVDILQMIEKRDVLINLHKDLNNKEKYMNIINYKI